MASDRSIISAVVRRVCKLLSRNCDPTPDSRSSVIAVCCKLLGTPVAIRFGLVSVSVDHQHRDTPDVDFPYHTRKGSSVYVSNCLPGKTGIAEPSLVWIFITQDPNRKLAVSRDLLPFATDRRIDRISASHTLSRPPVWRGHGDIMNDLVSIRPDRRANLTFRPIAE